MKTLAQWLEAEPRGALVRLFRSSGVSMDTLYRARRGEKVGLARAMRISRATGGEVPVQALTDECDDEPRAVA